MTHSRLLSPSLPSLGSIESVDSVASPPSNLSSCFAQSARKLDPGMLIRTSYGTGPYRIRHIDRGCTCPLYTDAINMRNPPPLPPHLHLELTDPDGKGRYWINQVDENSLTVLYPNWNGSHDRIEVLPPDKPVQLSLL